MTHPSTPRDTMPLSTSTQTMIPALRFDSVSAAFHALFPLEFDRAIPLFNCGAVEKLLLEWNRTMNSLDDVRSAGYGVTTTIITLGRAAH